MTHLSERNAMTEPAGEASLLLIEDNHDIAEMVTAYLERRGYNIDYAADGLTGLHLAVTNSYDAIILDLMLPGLDGLKLCQKVRTEARCDVPILMLTARDTLGDKVHGLDAGADDYVIKPFAIQELEARVRALIRRRRGHVAPEILRVADLSVDVATLKVERSGKNVNLTPIGLKILTVLMRASPRVLSRRELERQVWGDIMPDSDTLRSHLYNLRKAIDKPFATPLLHTLPGKGYQLADTDAR
jgi:DNA-binding response OmpR family regulator